MTASIDVVISRRVGLHRRELNRILRIGKSEAEVTNKKDY